MTGHNHAARRAVVQLLIVALAFGSTSAGAETSPPGPPTELRAAPGPGQGEITLSWEPAPGADTYKVLRSDPEVATLIRDDGSAEDEVALDDTGDRLAVTYELTRGALQHGREARISIHGRSQHCGVDAPSHVVAVNSIASARFNPCELFGATSDWADVEIPLSALIEGPNLVEVFKTDSDRFNRNLVASIDSASDGTVLRNLVPSGGAPLMRLEIESLGASYQQVATTGSSTFVDGGRTSGVPHRYQVLASNAAGESPAVGPVEAHAPRPPLEVVDLAAQAGPAGGEITLDWSPPEDTGGVPVTGYRISAGPAGSLSGQARDDDGVAEATYTLDGSTDRATKELIVPSSIMRNATSARLWMYGRSTTCFIRGLSKRLTVNGVSVAHVDRCDVWASDRIRWGSVEVPVAAIRPGEVNVFDLSNTSSVVMGVVLGLDRSTDLGRTDARQNSSRQQGELMFYLEVTRSGPTGPPTVVGSTSGTSFTEASLGPSANRYYSVSAANVAGDGPATPQVVARSFDLPPRPALSAGAGPRRGEITLTWSHSSQPPASSFRVYRGQVAPVTASVRDDDGTQESEFTNTNSLDVLTKSLSIPDEPVAYETATLWVHARAASCTSFATLSHRLLLGGKLAASFDPCAVWSTSEPQWRSFALPPGAVTPGEPLEVRISKVLNADWNRNLVVSLDTSTPGDDSHVGTSAFDDQPGELMWYLFLAGKGGVDMTHVATVGSTATFTDAALMDSAEKIYRVAAVNLAGEGSPSVGAIGVTFDGAVPVTPTVTAATPTGRDVSLAWQPGPAGNSQPPTGYRLYRGTVQDLTRTVRNDDGTAEVFAMPGYFDPDAVKLLDVPGGALDLAASARVWIYASKSSCSDGVNSHRLFVNSTGVWVQCGRWPSEPGWMSVEVPLAALISGQSNELRLRDLSSSGNNLNLGLDQSTDGSGSTVVVGGTAISGELMFYLELPRLIDDPDPQLIAELGATSFVDRDLPDSAYRYYYVEAVNDSGVSPASALARVQVYRRPNAPQNLYFDPEHCTSRVRLSWQPPDDDGGTPVRFYRVYRDVGAQPTLVAQTTATSAIDNLPSGGTYIYRVSALNDAGESPLSEAVSFRMGSGACYRFGSSDEGFATTVDQSGSDIRWDPGLGRVLVVSQRSDPGSEVFSRALPEPLTSASGDFGVSARWRTLWRGTSLFSPQATGFATVPFFVSSSGSADPVGSPSTLLLYHFGGDPTVSPRVPPSLSLRYRDAGGVLRINETYIGDANDLFVMFGYRVESRRLIAQVKRAADGAVILRGEHVLPAGESFDLRHMGMATQGWLALPDVPMAGHLDDVDLWYQPAG